MLFSLTKLIRLSQGYGDDDEAEGREALKDSALSGN
jgi:hypothetical protein